MENLLIFLLMALVSILLVKPRDKSQILTISILQPIITLIIYVAVVFNVKSEYASGQELGMSIIPAVISGLFIYFSLKRRLTNGNTTKVPILLIALIFLSLAGTILTLISRYNLYSQELFPGNYKQNFGDLKKPKDISKIGHFESISQNASSALAMGFESLDEEELDQDLSLNVNYHQVEFKLPSTWNYKSQEPEEDMIFQITAWEKGVGNTFMIQWIESEIDLYDYLEDIKGSVVELFNTDLAEFSENKIGDYKGNRTVYSLFTGEFLEQNLFGKLSVFNNGGRTFFIVYLGDNDFFHGQLPAKILSNMQIGFLTESDQSDSNDSWTLYEIQDIGQISIPPSLELRDENSVIALTADVVRDSYRVNKKIELGKSNLIFQPKGTNINDEESLSMYARVLINYIKGEPGEFYKCDEEFDFSDSEIEEINEYLRNETIRPMAAMNIKLISWDPVEFGQVNGLSYFKTSFIRQMNDNPYVRYIGYNFFNSDESVEIITSYRISERDIWESDFNKIIQTFDFEKRKD